MTAPDKAALLATARRAHKRAAVLQRSLDDTRQARDSALLDAQQAGATYPELAQTLGVTRDRVNQVLRAERDRRASTPTTAA